jgi:hypothetical protein
MNADGGRSMGEQNGRTNLSRQSYPECQCNNRQGVINLPEMKTLAVAA